MTRATLAGASFATVLVLLANAIGDRFLQTAPRTCDHLLHPA